VYISVASYTCQADASNACACGGLMDNVGGNLCIYQPEPGVKIPTSSPSRYFQPPFKGCECARYPVARMSPDA
jgi:hypothetical protein